MKNTPKLPILIGLFVIVLIGAYFQIRHMQNQKTTDFSKMEFIDLETIEPDWLKDRASQQLKQSESYPIFCDFKFTDLQSSSDISFRHKICPDGAVNHKPVHYDHGNGLAIADVDNDGLYDIYFVSQVGKAELWKNMGDGQFTNITDAAGLSSTEQSINASASFADIDNDGDADLFVTSVKSGNKMFENNGSGVFSDISDAAGLNYIGHSSGAVFFDYNNDGLLDLFVCNVGEFTTDEVADFKVDGKDYKYHVGHLDAFAGHLKSERFERSILYRNEGENKFVDVTIELGIEDYSWNGDAAILDGNEDGFLDLYLLNMQGGDQYYENQGGKGFVNKSRSLFPKSSWGAMGIQIFDFDNDGKQDVFTTDMHSDMGKNSYIPLDLELKKVKAPFPPEFLLNQEESLFGNSFYKKTGPDKYEEISDKIGAENYWPWGLSAGDLNADGYQDVFIASSMNYPFRYTENAVLLNNKGQNFLSSEFVLGVEPRRDNRFAQPWFELDCDGDDKEHKHCQGKKGNVTIYGALGSRSSVIFDLDNDGDLDIVTNEFNDVPMVLVSNLSDKSQALNYLKIKLIGTQSNKDGIGSEVIIQSDANTYTQVMDGKTGYLSQSSCPLYFGLGEAKSIDKITINWPSGTTQTISANLPINEEMVITEPTS